MSNQAHSRSEALEIIRTLETNDFYAECPCCDEPISLRHASLFYRDEFSKEGKELFNEYTQGLRDREVDLKEERKAISRTSETGARAVNLGFILERLAPSLKAFTFNKNDCRSLFDPIDYLIFEGLSTKGWVERILFVDFKTGQARLNKTQKEIQSLVERKKVSMDVFKPEAAL
jgi:predicted Holliday junction resolvase-like endonuclease